MPARFTGSTIACWISALAIVLAFATSPAASQEVVYPLNSRVGLVPPPGFTESTRIPGFENAEARAVILLGDFPAEAYAGLEQAFTDAVLQGRGMTVEKREPVTLPNGRGFMIFGRSAAGAVQQRDVILAVSLPNATALATAQLPEAAQSTLTDEILRSALLTIAVRERVPDEEKLAVMPYKFADFAGFRVVRAGRDGVALLTDGPQDTVQAVEQAFVLVRTVPGSAPVPEERDTVARRVFMSSPGLKEIRILRAEPLRIGGQIGHEILAEAKDARSGVDVTAVQWLRFGAGGAVHMFGIARKDAWASVFPRLRSLRDGLEVK